jgi:hypothetical protein
MVTNYELKYNFKTKRHKKISRRCGTVKNDLIYTDREFIQFEKQTPTKETFCITE